MVYLAASLVLIGVFLLLYGAILPYYKSKSPGTAAGNNFFSSALHGKQNAYGSGQRDLRGERKASSFAEGFLGKSNENSFRDREESSFNHPSYQKEFTNHSPQRDFLKQTDTFPSSPTEQTPIRRSSFIPQNHPQAYSSNSNNSSSDFSVEEKYREDKVREESPHSPSKTERKARAYGNPMQFSSLKSREKKAPIINGTLFLDKSQDISYTGSKLEIDKLDPASIQNLKRVDRAECQILGTDILFHTEISSFLYRQRNLSRIIFYDNAFVLIPRDDSVPVPVFLTSQSEVFKNYFYQLADK